jgi:exodeoxyribonuclease VII small subunit
MEIVAEGKGSEVRLVAAYDDDPDAFYPAEATFEDAMRDLSRIVEQLERGELPLEQSIALFEQGIKLAQSSQQKIDSAQQRIDELLSVDAEGKPKTKPFPTDHE